MASSADSGQPGPGPSYARAWLAAVLLLATPAIAETARFHPLPGPAGWPASWLATDGSTMAYGHLRRVHIETAGAPARELTLGAPVTGAVLLGPRLVLVEEGRRLLSVSVNEPATPPSAIDLGVKPQGVLHVAESRGVLIVAEDGFGLRLFESRANVGHASHAGHAAHRLPGTLHAAGTLELRESFTAMAGNATTVFAAMRGGRLAVIDVRDARHPTALQAVALLDDPQALAADTQSLYVLAKDGLHVMDLAHGVSHSSFHPEVRGTALQRNGRQLHVAADRGITTVVDRSPRGQSHTVSVNNNFFNPVSLTVQVGDTVTWQNTSGDDHNVYSCVPDQFGCDGAASSESFTSGDASTFWSYGYTFTRAGSNPYICQPHASFMGGTVTVESSGLGPPPVPDGSHGLPMTAAKLEADGSKLSIDWDVLACPGTNYEILYGMGSQLPSMPGNAIGLSGAACDVGGPPFRWIGVPDPASDSTRFLWWLVVATDGSSIEGSWGTDSSVIERKGPGAGGVSLECGITVKDVTNVCESSRRAYSVSNPEVVDEGSCGIPPGR